VKPPYGVKQLLLYFPQASRSRKLRRDSCCHNLNGYVLGSNFPADNTGNAVDLFADDAINVIIVDPANSNVLYLAAGGGLFRSTDGGRNWLQGTTSGIITGITEARSLVLDTTSPAANRILYAGISFEGVFQSTDGGQNWHKILGPDTAAVAAVLPPGAGFGGVVRVDLAPPTSPPNANGIQVLYASMVGGVPDPLGIFRSTDQGATWNRQNSTNIPTNTAAGFRFSMGVDPASPGDGVNDIIYLGAVGAGRSNDSGNTFNPVGPGIHVDSHSAWVFVRQSAPTPSIVFIGNDGGIWKSTDGGATWSGTGGTAPPTINAGGLQTSLFYNLDIKKDATASVTEGSLQDNGTVRTTGSLAWTDTTGGDGFDFVFETANTSIAYSTTGCASSPSGTLVLRSTDSGATWGLISDGTIPADELFCSLHPVSVDPNNAGFIYVGGTQSLFQSRDAGASFRNLNNFGDPIAEVQVARSNSNNVVVAVRSRVFVSTNALAATVGSPTGVTFTNVTRNLPSRLVTRVAFDPNDPTVIYAVLSGFNNQTPDQPGHIFRTTIAGSTWTNISPALDVPFNAIALDGTPSPTTIYVGTDLGVLRSVDGGASWAAFDDLHLPNVPVTDFALNVQAGVLQAATFGRGVFELMPPTGPVIAANAQNGLQFGNVCLGSPASLTIQVFNVGVQNLVINSVQRLFGSSGFIVLTNPSTPVIISPNAEVDFTVQFTPTPPGTQESATIRISSNDPAAPFFDLTATGGGTGAGERCRVSQARSTGATPGEYPQSRNEPL
jgi:photosystem II stability/assembly factor-like uncharacterized protein